MDQPLTGSCQCGAITYAVNANPLFTYACHCTDCQKRTGSAFSMGLVIVTDSLELEGALTAWTRNKQSWLTLPPRSRQFETQPEQAVALLQAALDYRSGK
jgi:hypothetical protein